MASRSFREACIISRCCTNVALLRMEVTNTVSRNGGQ
jgi:hypothetical protein